MSVKQQRSMASQSKLADKQQELQKLYANNQQKYNDELMKLYEKEGVNPGVLWREHSKIGPQHLKMLYNLQLRIHPQPSGRSHPRNAGNIISCLLHSLTFIMPAAVGMYNIISIVTSALQTLVMNKYFSTDQLTAGNEARRAVALELAVFYHK